MNNHNFWSYMLILIISAAADNGVYSVGYQSNRRLYIGDSVLVSDVSWDGYSFKFKVRFTQLIGVVS